MKSLARRLLLESLEDRSLPAVTSISGTVLTITLNAVNEAIVIQNPLGGNYQLSGSTFTGAGAGPFPVGNFTKFVLADSGSLAGQSATFVGGPPIFAGVSSTGVENVIFN